MFVQTKCIRVVHLWACRLEFTPKNIQNTACVCAKNKEAATANAGRHQQTCHANYVLGSRSEGDLLRFFFRVFCVELWVPRKTKYNKKRKRDFGLCFCMT